MRFNFLSAGRLHLMQRRYEIDVPILPRPIPGLRMPILCTVFILSFFAVNATAGTFHEYQVKAVFIYNLTHFITWPGTAFKDEKTPFHIGILGENPFGDTLQKVLRKEKIGGRPIKLLRYMDHEEIKRRPCHMLYIKKISDLYQSKLLETVRTRHILTISDTPGFLQLGGIISLVTKNRRIEIGINQTEARRMGFEISAQLLNLAKIY